MHPVVQARVSSERLLVIQGQSSAGPGSHLSEPGSGVTPLRCCPLESGTGLSPSREGTPTTWPRGAQSDHCHVLWRPREGPDAGMLRPPVQVKSARGLGHTAPGHVSTADWALADPCILVCNAG